MRGINLRLFLILLVASLVLGVGVYALHEYQIRRQVRLFTELAKKAETEGDLNQAIDYYQRYIHLVPDDVKVLETLGLHLADTGRLRDAQVRLGMVLQVKPDRDDLRRRLVEILFQRGRTEDARHHLEILLENDPDDALAHHQLAICSLAKSQHLAARDELNAALALDPSRLDSSALLAAVELEIDSNENELSKEARSVAALNAMVLENGDNYEAPLIRGNFFMSHRLDDEFVKQAVQACLPERAADPSTELDGHEFLQIVAQDAVTAIELAPDELGPIVLGAQCAQELKEPLHIAEEDWNATRLAERALEVAPNVPLAYSILANEALERQDMQAALQHLQKGVDAVGFDRSLFFNLARLKIQSDNVDEARALIERLKAEPDTDALVAYLHARVEMQQGRWRQASVLLEAARGGLDDLRDLRRDTDIALGICYGQLQRSDLQRAAYDRALTEDPSSRAALLGLAGALEALGLRDQALRKYEEISRQNGGRVSPMVAVQIARLKIRQNVSRANDDPIWEQVLNFVSAQRDFIASLRDDPAATVSDEEIEQSLVYLDILEAEFHLAKRDLDAAEATLVAAIERNPDAESLWNALIVVQGRKTDFEAAEETLQRACEIHGNSATMRLARARHELVKSGPAAVDVFRELAQPVESDSVEERLQVASGIAAYARLIGDVELATRLYREIAETDQNRLDARLVLFDLALRQSEQGDAPESAIKTMSAILEEVKQIEGEGPFWSYGEAVRLVVANENDSASFSELAEAEALLDSAQRESRDWARIPLLRGRIHEIRGDRDKAADSFVEAFQKGFRQPEFIYQLVRLLYSQERFNDAANVLASLSEEDAPNLTDLAQAANAVSAQVDDAARAAEIAALALQIAENAAKDSEDHLAKLTYGQILFFNKRFDDAERLFQEAIELAPAESIPWLALIEFYQRTERSSLAEATLHEAEKSIDESRREFALAQAYQILGDDETAADKYENVHADPEADAEKLRAAASFFIGQGEIEKSEELLQRMIDAEDSEGGFREHIVWARRQLAVLALARGGDENRGRARDFIERNLGDNPKSGDDRRILAQILAASREPADQSRAIGILRDLIDQSNAPRDQDRLMLAQLELGRYSRSDRKSQLAEAVGDDATARTEKNASRASLSRAIEQLRQLAIVAQSSQPAGTPSQPEKTDRTAEFQTYITLYIDALILNGEFSDARGWAEKLRPFASNAIQTAAVEATIAAKMGEHERARDLMVEQIPSCTEAAQLVTIARVLERLAGIAEKDLETDDDVDASAARDLYQAAARGAYEHELVQGDPDLSLALVSFMAREGEAEAAVNRLEGAWQAASPNVAANASLTIVHADTSDAVQSQAMEILKQVAANNPDELSVQVALAEGLAWLGDYPAAESVYESLLEQHPDSWAVANNLAFVLGASGQSERALKLIDSLLEQQGQLPDVLDTKASILLQAKEYRQAYHELKAALSQADVAVYYFHEAVALHNLNDEAAAKSWAKSQMLGLTPSHVHPTERDDMQLLAQRYGDSNDK